MRLILSFRRVAGAGSFGDVTRQMRNSCQQAAFRTLTLKPVHFSIVYTCSRRQTSQFRNIVVVYSDPRDKWKLMRIHTLTYYFATEC